MKKIKRAVSRKNPDSDTRSRTGKGGGSTITPIQKLDKLAARDLALKMRNQTSFREQIYQFDAGEGHKALGYTNRRECYRKIFTGYYSEQHVYQQLDAARVEHNLGDDLLPEGRTVSESVLRRIKTFTQKQQRKIYRRACRLSGKEIPTLKDIEAAIAEFFS